MAQPISLASVFSNIGNGAQLTAQDLLGLFPARGDDQSRLGYALRFPNPVVAAAKAVINPAARWLTESPLQERARLAAGMSQPAVAAGPAFDPNNPFADVMPQQGTQPGQYAGSQIGADIDNRVRSLAPGAVMTSGYRDQNKQNALRAAGRTNVVDSFHGLDAGRDYTAPKGMALSDLATKLKSGMPSNFQVIMEGDHVHIEPTGHPSDLRTGTGQFAGLFSNPFAGVPAAMGQAALGELNRGEHAAMQPFTVSADAINSPDAPTPLSAPPTDFSKSDADLQAMRPEMMLEADQRKLVRSDIFTGIGKSLMGLEDGAGLGKVLAAIGGGALAGKGAGEAEIRARTDQFDNKMAQWQQAVYQGDVAKAQTLHAEAEHTVNALNQHALTQWEADLDDFHKNNFNSTNANGDVTTSRINAKGGVDITTHPNVGAIQAGFAARKASTLGQIMGAAQDGNQSQLSPANSLVALGVSRAYQADPNGANGQGALSNLSGYLAGSVVEGGLTADLFSEQGKPGAESKQFQEFQKDIQRRVMALGYNPASKEYAEAAKMATASAIVGLINDPNAKTFRSNVLRLGTIGASASRGMNQLSAQTRTTTDYRGRTTSQTTEGN